MILVQWYDLYDNASRAGYRGVGIFGNRSVVPVSRIVGTGPEAERYRSRALEISGLFRTAGGEGQLLTESWNLQHGNNHRRPTIHIGNYPLFLSAVHVCV